MTLDLTGLPPTPAEVDAFLADTSPDAYEKVVDRLLASPRYGERMAVRWLDAARYADTNGYQTDGERTMWRWRDWVIDAFNRNMPFDQFTIEQTRRRPAAERRRCEQTDRHRLQPQPSRQRRGRHHPRGVRGRVRRRPRRDDGDRLARPDARLRRCHDHKFDPITQKEFYRLFAFFNNVPENGRAVKYGNSPPVIKPHRRRSRSTARRNSTAAGRGGAAGWRRSSRRLPRRKPHGRRRCAGAARSTGHQRAPSPCVCRWIAT